MGTLDDVDELAALLAEHGITPMLDMVLNHVSTEHEWFQRALAGEQRNRDYFYLRPAREDGSPPTNWVSKFSGSAWSPFTSALATDPEAARVAVSDQSAPVEHYLHLFDPGQADLDWHNPEVRARAAEVVNFWRSHGVHAFRFDVINLIGKTEPLQDAPAAVDDRIMYTDGPLVHEYLRELNRASFGVDPESVTVGEMSSTSLEACVKYSAPEREELSMVFNFHHLKVDYEDGQKWTRMRPDIPELKRLLDHWTRGLQEGGGWNALFWNNHDQPRALNRFGDVETWREESATMLATAIHLLRGTPYVYMGEEIGMTDPLYERIDDYVDVEAHNAHTALVASGVDPDEAFAIVRSKARDNARTPMQWDDSEHAGFSDATPWLRPTNQDRISVAREEADGGILPYYRRLIALRRTLPVISEGRYEPWALEHPEVLAYIRRLDEDDIGAGADAAGKRSPRALPVLCSFADHDTEIEIPEEFVGADVLISNREDAVPPDARSVQLTPFEAVGYALPVGAAP